MLKEHDTRASALINGDRFELAKQMYEVEDVSIDAYDNRIISAHPLDGDPTVRIVTTVPPDTEFTIWTNTN